MQRKTKNKAKTGSKRKAAETERTGTAASALDALTKPLKALFVNSPIEAATALERLAHACQRWVLEEDLNRERGKLLRERDQHEHGSKAYDRVQRKVDEIAARKVDWDPSWMPLMLLDRRVRELASTTPDTKKPSNAAEYWDGLTPIAALLLEQLKGLPEALTPWSHGVGDGQWCRTRVLANIEARPAFVTSLLSKGEAALARLDQRDDAARAIDVLESLRGLRALFAALTYLRAELLEPGLHLKPAAWDAVIARAREQARTMGENWPAGACEPVALAARDDVAPRLGLALARLSQPGRTRDQRHAETLDEGIALLDQYVGPVCKWKPLPLPVAHVDPVRSATGQTNAPPSGDPPMRGAWFSQAVRKYAPGLVELKPSDLSRKRDELGARRAPGASGQWLYPIASVVDHPSFSPYKAAIMKARDENMPLERGKPRGPQTKKTR